MKRGITLAVRRGIGLASLLVLSACNGSSPAGSDAAEPDARVPDGISCVGVTCTTPPADACKDAKTLLDYSSPGTCNPDTGRCEYLPTERTCISGCEAGACQGGNTAWGWIAVVEKGGEGVTWDETMEGVQAHFSQDFYYTRSLPHHATMYLTEQATSGPCTLYLNQASYSMCMPACNQNQECVDVQVDGGIAFECRMREGIFGAGTLTVTGLKAAVSLEPDAFKRYIASGMPEDLFDMGATIQATTSGGELGPLTLSAKGVAPLTVASNAVPLRAGQAVTIAWTPADPGSRVKVVLRAGIHYPAPPVRALVCDAEDSDGQVVIAASLVDGFLGDAFVNQVSNWIVRYTSQVTTPWGKPVELFVGHSVGLSVWKEE